MKFRYIFLVSILLLLTACQEKDQLVKIEPGVQQYIPNFPGQDLATQPHSSVFLLSQGIAFTDPMRSKISVDGLIADKNQQMATVTNFSINGVTISPTLDQDGRPVEGVFQQGFRPDAGENSQYYSQLNQIFQGQSVEVDLSASELGNIRQTVTCPTLTNVSFASNRFIGSRNNRIIYGGEGIKITWDAPSSNGQSFLPDEELEVGILVKYDAHATAREYPGETFPNEDMVYTIITSNDGEHTIDFTGIADFPSGGVHTVTIANGMTFSFEFDDTDNIIYMHNGNIIDSGPFIITGCPDEDSYMDDQGNISIGLCDCDNIDC